jgi:Insertion element 4 transposase N-terminal
VGMVRGPSSGLRAVDEGAYDRLTASIDPAWVDAALAATGTATLRKRRLPAEQVIWLVLGMALSRAAIERRKPCATRVQSRGPDHAHRSCGIPSLAHSGPGHGLPGH